MEQCLSAKEIAKTANRCFDTDIFRFLHTWAHDHADQILLRFEQTLEEYLENDALRDFFITTANPIQALLADFAIAQHLGRCATAVYFDPISGDPLLAHTEQRIYNLARRLDKDSTHVPFRSVQPSKQTDEGDTACVSSYPIDSEELRYNSGNHFSSRSANDNVFDENRKRCIANSNGNLRVFFKRGYLEDRLRDVKELTAAMHEAGVTQLQYFVIYSRHSVIEGHFGVSLVIMDPANPNLPQRVMVCDTLLKELPQHPRWWLHFVSEYSNVFGPAVAELIEDLSHPLQKVNIKGDDPFRHDWDCPYYAASMADALVDLVKRQPELILNGELHHVHNAMKDIMPDYYHQGQELKSRSDIQEVNRLKRWKSGTQVINDLVAENSRRSSYEF